MEQNTLDGYSSDPQTSLSVCSIAKPTREAKPELLLFVLSEILVPCNFYS